MCASALQSFSAVMVIGRGDVNGLGELGETAVYCWKGGVESWVI